MNILIINGYQSHPFCKGELNFSLLNIMLNKLRKQHQVQLSSVEDYNVMDERNKFFWADLIIFQFPIYWFNVPGKLKLYMDQVFEYGQFYTFADEYGSGGLLKDKSYILSTTWNAPEEVFNHPDKFFEGKSVDDLFIPFHKTMEFCGLNHQGTLSFHNVVKAPNFEGYRQKLEHFLNNKCGLEETDASNF
ncbi:NAD(P)H-dependent oxidoreductase [Streptococcus massiliensis]|uniref:Flavodoxin-like fold-containing dehydrogenase n=1 Tax=Streptococcus massiliensis TaxID=313439 RepID=A0A380KZS1_9STRE|nr:NAD(P)H-dependent oxidoreductase [Streptococcus massiliensis]SUN76594.1 flavodoxin-like fold-containing dehydrogenase [Streptococcus massiliensis]